MTNLERVISAHNLKWDRIGQDLDDTAIAIKFMVESYGGTCDVAPDDIIFCNKSLVGLFHEQGECLPSMSSAVGAFEEARRLSVEINESGLDPVKVVALTHDINTRRSKIHYI